VLQAGQHAALVGRVMGRYQAPRAASGEPVPAHWGGSECLAVGAHSKACGCMCEACRVAVG